MVLLWLLGALTLAGIAVTPAVSSWTKWLHYQLTAVSPRLVYKSTPENERLLARCKYMTQRKYYPLWYLFNGHLQTVMLAHANSFEKYPKVVYERQILDLPDGGIVSLDWALPTRSNGTTPLVADLDRNRRTVLILPGLTGGSSEHYIRSSVDRFLEYGWQVLVLNARGCAKTPLKTPHLFCCAYTDDLRYVAKYLSDKYNFVSEAFIALGFSMGSNVLVKYLGEEQEKTPFTAAISVGNPFDMVKCCANIDSTLFQRVTYGRVLAQSLRDLIFVNSNAHEVFKDYPGLDLEALKNSKTTYEFDDIFTRVVFKYNSVPEFYQDGSCVTRLPKIRIPLLCLNAEDDPVSIATAIPTRDQVEVNSNIILCTTKAGGHLAFYEGDHDDSKDKLTKPVTSSINSRRTSPLKSWSAKVITEYAESIRMRQLEVATINDQ